MSSGTRTTAVPMAPAEQVLDRPPPVVIDLRSPGEYAEDHFPGAHNVPLFDDIDRAVIGTLYARRSRDEAFEEGRVRTQAAIDGIVRRIGELTGWKAPALDLAQCVELMTRDGLDAMDGQLEPASAETGPDSVVLYCWRGGLRSRAMLAFLRGLGLRTALGIAGGYRSYRACVRERIGAWRSPPSFVLRGLTGVGKTLVLRELARTHPGWVLDLEALAGHRSSILGMVGLEPATQKRFESGLAERIARGFDGVCVVEGESRKVGDLVLPESVWHAVDRGTALELVAPRERRVRVLLDDYLSAPQNREPLARQLPFIEARLGRRWSGVLTGLLHAGKEAELVELLLERYYDPLYRHSEGARRYAARFEASDPACAAREIASWIEATRAAGSALPASPRHIARPADRAGL